MGVDTMIFSEALERLQRGEKVKRSQWASHIFIKPDSLYTSKAVIYWGHSVEKYYEWEPIQEDILAQDWLCA